MIYLAGGGSLAEKESAAAANCQLAWFKEELFVFFLWRGLGFITIKKRKNERKKEKQKIGKNLLISIYN